MDWTVAQRQEARDCLAKAEELVVDCRFTQVDRVLADAMLLPMDQAVMARVDRLRGSLESARFRLRAGRGTIWLGSPKDEELRTDLLHVFWAELIELEEADLMAADEVTTSDLKYLRSDYAVLGHAEWKHESFSCRMRARALAVSIKFGEPDSWESEVQQLRAAVDAMRNPPPVALRWLAVGLIRLGRLEEADEILERHTAGPLPLLDHLLLGFVIAHRLLAEPEVDGRIAAEQLELAIKGALGYQLVAPTLNAVRLVDPWLQSW